MGVRGCEGAPQRAAFTSFIALGVLIIVSLLDREGGAPWMFTKLEAGTFILAVGAATVRRLWSSRPAKPLSDRRILAFAASLIPFGGLTIVGTARLAMRTGDMEWYMVVAGLAMICQGFLTLLTLSSKGVATRA